LVFVLLCQIFLFVDLFLFCFVNSVCLLICFVNSCLFVDLVVLQEEKWTERKWAGPRQFQDSSGKLMMLPSDLALIQDPAFVQWVDLYAQDEDRFHADFARAWTKLMELGVDFAPKPVFEKLFG
jgi:hypothetical protein